MCKHITYHIQSLSGCESCTMYKVFRALRIESAQFIPKQYKYLLRNNNFVVIFIAYVLNPLIMQYTYQE